MTQSNYHEKGQRFMIKNFTAGTMEPFDEGAATVIKRCDSPDWYVVSFDSDMGPATFARFIDPAAHPLKGRMT